MGTYKGKPCVYINDLNIDPSQKVIIFGCESKARTHTGFNLTGTIKEIKNTAPLILSLPIHRVGTMREILMVEVILPELEL